MASSFGSKFGMIFITALISAVFSIGSTFLFMYLTEYKEELRTSSAVKTNIISLCNYVAEIKEDLFESQCRLEQGKYDFNTHICTKASGPPQRVRINPCPELNLLTHP